MSMAPPNPNIPDKLPQNINCGEDFFLKLLMQQHDEQDMEELLPLEDVGMIPSAAELIIDYEDEKADNLHQPSNLHKADSLLLSW
eukprot:7446970-Ditylum_brightwellii.AAC.1